MKLKESELQLLEIYRSRIQSMSVDSYYERELNPADVEALCDAVLIIINKLLEEN